MNNSAAKVVSSEMEYKAHIKVTLEGTVKINPNGRGYSEDDIHRRVEEDLATFTVKAPNSKRLREKVLTLLSTLDDGNDDTVATPGPTYPPGVR